MILRHRADFRSIVFVLAFVGAQGLLYAQDASVVWIPILGLGCAIVGGVNHNQMHSPAFRAAWLNRAWCFPLSWAMGASATQITVTHILVHHRFYRNENDSTRWTLARGRGVPRLFSYLKNSVAAISRHRREFLASPGHLRWRAGIRSERAVLWIAALALFAMKPTSFLICYLAPWILGLALVLVVNLLQHDGLDLKSERHSRDFVGRFGNWFTFNSFFHTVHHERPSLHWSLLPAEHRRRELDGEKSFWIYLWSDYVVVSWKRS